MSKWPHSPSHEVTHPGAYMITAATYHKHKYFHGEERLELLEDVLLSMLDKLGWKVQAWAVFPNHYHFVGLSPDTGLDLAGLTGRIHGKSTIELNKLDGMPGRNIWYRSWDTRLSFQKSYLARLAYVHNNPVKDGLVNDSAHYRWCSAKWFAENADRPFYETVMLFATDRVNVYDDFDEEGAF